MTTEVIAPFADGEYRFWLGLPQLVELERKCGDTSVLVLEERLRGAIGVDDKGKFTFLGGGSAMIADVRETIRLALIGGASGVVDGADIEVGPQRAMQLVETYVCPARPLSEGVVLAWRILHTLLNGADLKKKSDQEGSEADLSESPSSEGS